MVLYDSMVSYKHAIINIKFAVILICIVTTTTRGADTDSNEKDWSCKTPEGDDGYCIPLRLCKPMMRLVSQLKKSQGLTEAVTEFMKTFVCGYQKKLTRVCCPFAPILLPKHRSFPMDIDNHPNKNLLPLNCGLVNKEDRVFGGSKTGIFEFPWMALLSYNRDGESIGFQCGGTIINRWYILTAAHCLVDLSGLTLTHVRVGEHDIDSPTDCEQVDHQDKVCAPPVQDIDIAETLPHPNYNGIKYTNDIALIRLASPINTNQENSKAICLPIEQSLRNQEMSSYNFTITGWGLINISERSSKLLKAYIPALTEKNCRRSFENSTSITITSDHICAGSKTSDAYSGDSGGPLQRIDNFFNVHRYIQFGVMAFGPKLCGNTRAPGVYTKVEPYLNWILDHLRP